MTDRTDGRPLERPGGHARPRDGAADRPRPPDRAAGRAGRPNRRRAALAVLPFLALGLADVVLLLRWGLDPLWGFVVLPPICFMTVLGWLAFRSGFHGRRGRPREGG